MDRIIFFGCSLTYGHGLPDCHIAPNYPGKTPSKMGWPSIVAKNMNRNYINKSNPGSSNKRIWKDVITFDYMQTDIVFIQWSYPDRTCIFERNSIKNIGPWSDPNFYKDYYHEKDSVLMSKLYVNHANTFLSHSNIKVYNLIIKDIHYDILSLNKDKVDHIPVYMNKLVQKYPYALDNKHPGIECNEEYAAQILDYLGISSKPRNDSMIEKIKRILDAYRH